MNLLLMQAIHVEYRAIFYSWGKKKKKKKWRRRIGALSATILNDAFFNSFGAKFQTTFVVCFSFLTNFRLKKVYT